MSASLTGDCSRAHAAPARGAAKGQPLAWALRLVVAALFSVGFCQGQAAPVLFGSAYAGNNGQATLYLVDPATGGVTPIGPIKFARVGAIAFNSGGALYGVGTNASSDIVLLRINTTTGEGTQVALLSNVANRYLTQDISFRNADGKLFSYQQGAFYTINTATAVETLVGDTGPNFPLGDGMAFSAADVLYNANETNLLTVSQTTGATLTTTPLTYPLGPDGLPTNARANAMDFDKTTGILWASVTTGASGINYLATINTTTGVVTEIGETVGGLDGLAVQPVVGDSDGDGVPDATDNCINVPNADQRDTDGDGYGNLCDADLNNDGTTDTLDLNIFKAAYRSKVGDPNYNANADLNGDGRIDTLDLNIFKALYRKPPGPSGLHPPP